MYNGKKYFTVVNNGTGEPRRVKIQNKQGKTPRIIFSTNRMDSKPEKQPEWTMNPWECTVMMWE